MDYLLHSNRQQTDRIVLGKVKYSKLVQSQDVRTMCPASICNGTNRVFCGEQVEGNNMLQQSTSTRMLGTPSLTLKKKTKLQMRQYQTKFPGHKTGTLRNL